MDPIWDIHSFFVGGILPAISPKKLEVFRDSFHTYNPHLKKLWLEDGLEML